MTRLRVVVRWEPTSVDGSQKAPIACFVSRRGVEGETMDVRGRTLDEIGDALAMQGWHRVTPRTSETEATNHGA